MEYKSSWYNVLYPGPGIAARDADQELEGVRGHRHAGRRNQGQQGEEHGPRPVRVHSALRQEQGFQVVGQRDGNYRKVCRQGEHGKQSQKYVNCKLQPVVRVRWLKY